MADEPKGEPVSSDVAKDVPRIGQGWDVHRLEPGGPLRLGGIDIPHDQALAGHSDADILLHAVCDAVLGAAAMGDIGEHFPDTDPQYRGADSTELLRVVIERVRDAGWRVVQIDATVIAEEPKLAPHKLAMRESLARLTGAPLDRVNVKAKTAERLNAVGEGRSMEAQVVAMLLPV